MLGLWKDIQAQGIEVQRLEWGGDRDNTRPWGPQEGLLSAELSCSLVRTQPGGSCPDLTRVHGAPLAVWGVHYRGCWCAGGRARALEAGKWGIS